jgi:hypothetical protein
MKDVCVRSAIIVTSAITAAVIYNLARFGALPW